MRRCELLAIVLLGGVAHAQPAPAPPAAPADVAYQEGRKHYDLREWDLAIAQFKEAYRLRPDAPALFNIAQSYRLKGDCVEAASFYRTYKRNFPAEKNIDKVDKFIVEMDACAKTRSTEPTGLAGTTSPTPVDPEPPPGPTAPPTPTGPELAPTPGPAAQPIEGSPAPATSGSPGRTLRIAGLVTAGVGAGLVIGGAVSGLSAQQKAEDLEALPTFDPALDEDGRAANRRAKLLLGIGGAAVVTGAVLFVVGMTRSESPRPTVGFVPHADGGLVTWSGGF